MSKINFNDLEDYYEDEGYDVCPKCGESEFEFDEETNSYSVCSICGHKDVYVIKQKKQRQNNKKNKFGEDDFYDSDY